MTKDDHWYSNPTPRYWTCKNLIEGLTLSTKTEVREVNGWRLAAITETLRRQYGWPIETELRGPENIAYYRLKPGTDPAKLRFPPFAKALADEVPQ